MVPDRNLIRILRGDGGMSFIPPSELPFPKQFGMAVVEQQLQLNVRLLMSNKQQCLTDTLRHVLRLHILAP
jgi:hypothetical protein